MLVTESSIFPPPKMKVRVSCMCGTDLVLDVEPDASADSVKILALQRLTGLRADAATAHASSSSDDSVKKSIYHKLVQVSAGKTLVDEKSLKDQGVEDRDELILINRRLPSAASFRTLSKKDESTQAPTLDMIQQHTQALPSVHSDRTTGQHINVDFQRELRKILISLIDAAQKLLCLNPDAAKIFKEAEEIMEEQNSGTTAVDSGALKQLTDMGFPENRATKALILNRMSAIEAMEWLLQHEADPEIDEPLPGVTSVHDHNDNNQLLGATPDGLVTQETQSADLSPVSRKVSRILQSFKAFKRKEFRPNPRAFQNLKDMGFAEKDVIDALRINRNREEAACEWLLSGKNYEVPDDDSGLDTDSQLYKAIMSNHIVQLGLTNPRSLIAFLNMLENPGNTQQWLTDQDTGPMLIQISRIYHAERNVSN